MGVGRGQVCPNAPCDFSFVSENKRVMAYPCSALVFLGINNKLSFIQLWHLEGAFAN